MKAYTDIEQSKKLAEILSNETSDMYYWCGESIRFGGCKAQDKDYDIPCWSLAALLSLIPRPDLHQTKGGQWCCIAEPNSMVFSRHFDNPVDACVDMIYILK